MAEPGSGTVGSENPIDDRTAMQMIKRQKFSLGMYQMSETVSGQDRACEPQVGLMPKPRSRGSTTLHDC